MMKQENKTAKDSRIALNKLIRGNSETAKEASKLTATEATGKCKELSDKLAKELQEGGINAEVIKANTA